VKYIRFLSQEDQTCSGIVQSDDSIATIEGDILGENRRTGQVVGVGEVKQYLPPIVPPNVLALGLNYRAHAIESGSDIPQAPQLFIKAATCLTGHRCPIVLPKPAPDEVDYEAELAVVIGKKAKNVSADEALDYVFGYMCANDVSARDCQRRIDKQWARAKSFDTFGPMGPVIETELDPTDLRIRSILNGQCMQDSRTSDLIFSVVEIVSYLSTNLTLLPGTVILTGTPSGVGCARKPPVFLQPGDKIEVEIEGIATLENSVVAE